MKLSPFDFQNHHACLKAVFRERRGLLSAVARRLNCQPAYLSQVVSGKLDLSLEHAYTLCDEFAWGSEESRFFMLLVQKDRAGSVALVKFFVQEIEEIRNRRAQIANRIEVQRGLQPEDQARYYSSWFYAAIHILSAMPKYRQRERLRKFLNLERAEFDGIVEFLIERGLVIAKHDELEIGTTRVHLPAGSPELARHHANWKLRAIESCQRLRTENLHYSGIIGISGEDRTRLRELFLRFIADIEKIVKDSPFEEPFVLNLDFFDLASSL